ncbi:MAG: hypothetical protein ACRDZY_20370, partial [Acidimicrobiales bacterium]
MLIELPAVHRGLHMHSTSEPISHQLPHRQTTALPSMLDRALFTAPFVLLAKDNTAHLVTFQLEDATELLGRDPQARSIVGTLRRPFIAVDIDPSDTGSPAEAGCALSDDLVAWAERLGLPWLRRASGRPGHIHFVVKVPDPLDGDLEAIVRRASAHHEVAATVRRSLRLTSAPHRLQLPSPILDGTLTPADVPPKDRTCGRQSQPRKGYSRRRRSPRRGGKSRSEGEYGDTLALARAGMTAAAAWTWLNRPHSKA